MAVTSSTEERELSGRWEKAIVNDLRRCWPTNRYVKLAEINASDMDPVFVGDEIGVWYAVLDVDAVTFPPGVRLLVLFPDGSIGERWFEDEQEAIVYAV